MRDAEAHTRRRGEAEDREHIDTKDGDESREGRCGDEEYDESRDEEEDDGEQDAKKALARRRGRLSLSLSPSLSLSFSLSRPDRRRGLGWRTDCPPRRAFVLRGALACLH